MFMCGDIRFGVAQGSYMTRKNLTAAEALLKPYLEEARNKQNVEDIYMLLTDVPKEESVVICNGRYAAEVLSDGFGTQPAADASWTLPGVVSRKKAVHPRPDDRLSGAVRKGHCPSALLDDFFRLRNISPVGGSLSSKGEPLAKHQTFMDCQSLSLWERWHCGRRGRAR